MRFPVERYDSLTEVETVAELLAGPGDRVVRRPARQVFGPEFATIAAGVPERFFWPRNTVGVHEIAKFDDVVYFPKRTFVNYQRGTVPIGCFRQPHFAPDEIEVPPPPVEPRIVKGVTYSIDTSHSGYGHLLLEALSQLWAIDEIRPTRLLINRRATESFRNMLEAFGPRSYLGKREPLLLRHLVLVTPAYVLDHTITEDFVRLCHTVRDHFDPDGVAQDRLYVSRRGIDKRSLTNEAEIEALFAARGFRIMRPEHESIGDQIRAFSRAAIVAGPVGSGLYNVAFSRRGTRRIILAQPSFHTQNDMLLSAFTGVAPIYAFGSGAIQRRRDAMMADWYLPPENALAALAEAGC